MPTENPQHESEYLEKNASEEEPQQGETTEDADAQETDDSSQKPED